MSRVVGGIGIVVTALFAGGGVARAEGPASPPCPPVPAVDLAAEPRAFELEMALFARRWEFTQRLVAQRETRAFEEAEARYARFAELTRKLAADAAAQAERQFDAAVTLFVKKRELTTTLAASPKPSSVTAPATPAGPAAAPAPAPAH